MLRPYQEGQRLKNRAGESWDQLDLVIGWICVGSGRRGMVGYWGAVERGLLGWLPGHWFELLFYDMTQGFTDISLELCLNLCFISVPPNIVWSNRWLQLPPRGLSPVPSSTRGHTSNGGLSQRQIWSCHSSKTSQLALYWSKSKPPILAYKALHKPTQPLPVAFTKLISFAQVPLRVSFPLHMMTLTATEAPPTAALRILLIPYLAILSSL